MKTIKKLFTLILTIALAVFTVASPVFAANTERGKITINNTIAGESYSIYQILDLTYQGTKVSYTIPEEWEGFFIGYNAPGKDYLVTTVTNHPVTVEINDKLETRYLALEEKDLSAFLKLALEYIADTNAVAEETQKATETTVVFKDLDLGYYLVYPDGATKPDATNTVSSSVASLTSTLNEVTVNIKGGYPTLTKDVNKHSFEVGTNAVFTLTGSVPITEGYNSYLYEITDTWTEGLELVNNDLVNLVVNVGDVTLANETNYTYTKEAGKFVLTIPMLNADKEALYTAGTTITVTYELRVNEKAIKAIQENKAFLTYSSNPKRSNATRTTTPDKERVYSSELTIFKYDGTNESAEGFDKTQNPLANAEFVLQNDAGKYYQITKSTVTTDGKVFDINWVKEAEATIFKTNAEGKAIATIQGDENTTISVEAFQGLEEGTYTLTEVEAPNGYNKLLAPVSVIVEELEEEKLNDTTVELTAIEVTTGHTDIANLTGAELPSTGALGTKLFIIIGSALALISAIVLVTNKRMAKEM